MIYRTRGGKNQQNTADILDGGGGRAVWKGEVLKGDLKVSNVGTLKTRGNF